MSRLSRSTLNFDPLLKISIVLIPLSSYYCIEMKEIIQNSLQFYVIIGTIANLLTTIFVLRPSSADEQHCK